MMEKIKVGIQGASGKTGSLLLEVIGHYPEFALGAALVNPEEKELLGQNTGCDGVTFSSDLREAANVCDCFVDFSLPSATLSLLEAVSPLGKPTLVCTTGFNSHQLELIKSYSKQMPLLLSSNNSLGVFTLREIVTNALKYLDESFDIEIVEKHHKDKRDAPSGTALSLAEAIQKEKPDFNISCGRAAGPNALRKGGEIGIASLRGGDTIGEHTVCFMGQGESIEITHRAYDRRIFAHGAFKLLKWLVKAERGLYSPSDAFGNTVNTAT